MTDELDPNLELYPEWRQALKLFLEAGFTYGDIVPHDWFYEVFKLPPLAEQARMTYEQAQRVKLKRLAQFEKLQEALLTKHQIDLQPEPSVGYALVPPAEQTKRALTDGMKAIKKAVRDMADRGTNTNTALLTTEQRREHADMLAQMGMLRRMLRPARELPAVDDE